LLFQASVESPDYFGLSNKAIGTLFKGIQLLDSPGKKDLLRWYEKEFCFQAVSFDWRLLVFVKVHTEELHLRALETILTLRYNKMNYHQRRKHSLKYKTQTDRVFRQALRLVPDLGSDSENDDLPLLRVMQNPTRKVMLKVLRHFPLNLRFIDNPDRTMILSAVTENGAALEYVTDQDDEICKTAVSNYPYALQYVKNQTEEICESALSQDAKALLYVEKPTMRILKFAIKLEPKAVSMVNIKQFPEIAEYHKLLNS
jgi:hypothetical protein